MCRYSEIAPTRVAGRREFRFPTMRHNSCVVEERDYGLPQYVFAFNCSTQPTLNCTFLVCGAYPILLPGDLGSFGFVSQKWIWRFHRGNFSYSSPTGHVSLSSFTPAVASAWRRCLAEDLSQFLPQRLRRLRTRYETH